MESLYSVPDATVSGSAQKAIVLDLCSDALNPYFLWISSQPEDSVACPGTGLALLSWNFFLHPRHIRYDTEPHVN